MGSRAGAARCRCCAAGCRGLPDLVFGIVLVVGPDRGPDRLPQRPRDVLAPPARPRDPRTGRRAAVRHADLYPRPGRPGSTSRGPSTSGLALLVDHAGWSAAIAATALGLAWLYGALARGLIRDGHSPVVAVIVTVLATGVGAIHFLVRPHLFTLGVRLLDLAGLPGAARARGLVDRDRPAADGRLGEPPRRLPGRPADRPDGGDRPCDLGPAGRRRGGANSRRFAAVFVLSCLAPLVNPYGFGLYRHVGHLLVSSGVTDLIDEYQPIPFGKANGRVFEWIVLALVALPSLSTRRIDRYALAHALVWLHLALGSIRHAPLFALAAAPGPGAAARRPAPGRARPRPPAVAAGRPGRSLVTLALVLAVAGGLRFGGFSPKVWPLAALPVLNRQPVGARLFHEQDWGGMIEAECRPPRRAYLDDRFELFGKEAILEYVDALQGGPAWDALRDRERIDLVWVRPERGLARRLAGDTDWRVLHRDSVSVLFKREAFAHSLAGR